MENLVEFLKISLSFYANPDNYKKTEFHKCGLINSDGGNQARFALVSIDKYFNEKVYDNIMNENILLADDNAKTFESFNNLMKEQNNMGKLLDEKESIGLAQLRAKKEEIISKWENLGLLEGLEGHDKENCAQLFESQSSYMLTDEDIKELEQLKKERND